MGRVARASIASATFVCLLACGGGSSSPQADQPHLFPTVVSDSTPSGATVDLTAGNYFPFAAGDTWTYDVYDASQRDFTGEATVRVLSGPDAQGIYVVEATDSSSGRSTRTRYQKTTQGLVNLEPLADVLSPRAASIVGPLLAVPAPMTPVGLWRTSIRKGSWGADEDGDGIFDGFELTYSQTFTGFSVSTPSPITSNVLPPLASIDTRTTLTLLASRAGYTGSTATIAETETLAPGLGPIKLDITVGNSLQPGNDQYRTLTLKSATINGQQTPSDPALVFATSMHVDQVYDAARHRFLIALPTGKTHPPLILAVDTDAMFSTAVKNLDAEPFAMAASSDGASLFVSTARGEVIRYRLSDMQETGRLTVPNSRCIKRLVASPTESNVLLAHMRMCDPYSTPQDVVLIRDMAVVGFEYSVPKFLHAFSSDGTMVYGHEEFSHPTPGFARLDVTASGLVYKDFVTANPATTAYPVINFEVRDGRVLFGEIILDEATFAPVGSLNNVAGRCTTAASKWICGTRIEPNPMVTSLLVFDAATHAEESHVDYEFSFAARYLPSAHAVFFTRGRPGELLIGRAGTRSDSYEGGIPTSEFYLVRSANLP
jgi:hypothetical protein